MVRKHDQTIDDTPVGRHQRRTGITLVELLAALMLGAMLLTSLTGVIAGFARQQSVIEDFQEVGWRARLESRIRWDLLNARRIRTTKHGIVLEGFGSRDRATGRPTFLPSRVHYQIERINGAHCLTRTIDANGESPDIQAAQFEFMATGPAELLAGRASDRIADMRIDSGIHLPYTAPADVRVLLLDEAGEVIADVVAGRSPGAAR